MNFSSTAPLTHGDCRELLLIEGLVQNGLGNWAAAAEYTGTRTPEEAQQHYHDVYEESPTWPLPVCHTGDVGLHVT